MTSLSGPSVNSRADREQMEVAAHTQGRDTAPPQPFSFLCSVTRKTERKEGGGGKKKGKHFPGSAIGVNTAGD